MPDIWGYDITTAGIHSNAHDLRTRAALRSVAAAGSDLTVAKCTKSLEVVDEAQHDLQDAVDAARDLGVEWGRIGAALGIARGNAYQRFRKHPVG